MNEDANLSNLLAAEMIDTGCAAGFDVLHQYVESELSGGDAEREFPAVATHLRNCPACREDYLGLLDLVAHYGDAAPSGAPDQ